MMKRIRNCISKSTVLVLVLLISHISSRHGFFRFLLLLLAAQRCLLSINYLSTRDNLRNLYSQNKQTENQPLPIRLNRQSHPYLLSNLPPHVVVTTVHITSQRPSDGGGGEELAQKHTHTHTQSTHPAPFHLHTTTTTSPLSQPTHQQQCPQQPPNNHRPQHLPSHPAHRPSENKPSPSPKPPTSHTPRAANSPPPPRAPTTTCAS